MNYGVIIIKYTYINYIFLQLFNPILIFHRLYIKGNIYSYGYIEANIQAVKANFKIVTQ